MSHFNVLVVGDYPEQQLAPFQENNMGDCPEEYMEFDDRTEEIEDEYANGTKKEWHPKATLHLSQDLVDRVEKGEVIDLRDHVPDAFSNAVEKGTKYLIADVANKNMHVLCNLHANVIDSTPLNVEETKKALLRYEASYTNQEGVLNTTALNNFVSGIRHLKLQKVAPPKDVAFKEIYPDIDTFAQDWYGFADKDEEHDAYGYWENPNCKWDWYQLGGRWRGSFLLKEGGKKHDESEVSWAANGSLPENRVDQAYVKDIDWDKMADESLENAIEMWKDFQEKRKADPTFDGRWSHGVKEGKEEDEEYYLENSWEFSTFAVLKDGEWYENGSMGWWGVVSDEKEEHSWKQEFEKLVRGLPEDTLLSVYDCHIQETVCFI